MRNNRRWRTAVAVLATLALIGLAVVAAQGTGGQMAGTSEVTAPVEQSAAPCTGECATCPHAGTEGCPVAHQTPAASASESTLDTDKCIGCVRCVNVSPEAFRMNSETGKAELIPGAPAECVERGALACPVHAITP